MFAFALGIEGAEEPEQGRFSEQIPINLDKN